MENESADLARIASISTPKEAMVSQAQSTVLSMFTIACALAATISGIVFDTAGWKGQGSWDPFWATFKLHANTSGHLRSFCLRIFLS